MTLEDLNTGKSLAAHFICSARANWNRRCISDSTGKKLNYGQTLTAVIALAEKIDALTKDRQKIGILLPSSVAAALANIAVSLLDKIPVNLNYSLSEKLIKSAVEQSDIKVVLTSRSFAQWYENIDALPGLIFLEDLKNKLSFASKLKAYIKARFISPDVLTNAKKFSPDDLAAIIFSSGSSGIPKGVMLSHNNIFSNVQSIRSVVQLYPDDNVCGVLPFFHSFGFTVSLWLPLIAGLSASYAANPLDGKAVGKIARENNSTILFTSPTFLLSYIRRSEPDDFKTLRLVVVGAEKLKRTIADAFERKFKIRPQEGYGCTELSPVVSINLTKDQGTGKCKVGLKQGTIGMPITGVQVKIVSTETNQDLPAGKEGLLMVKGPNVMLGYLNNKIKTQDVIRDGWYNTGDIASIDEDGFITIKDRLSRFSKIAGEMVPHLGIEQALLKALNTHEPIIAVISIPHPKKGEELIVFHTEKAPDADKLHKILSQSGLPNIWKPRRDNYIKIETLPTLGSGKLDVMKLKKIALAAKNESQR